MAKRRTKRVLRPRTPSRVKRRKRAAKQRSHHHPELVGLGLTAVGLFLATLVYLRWEGGRAGESLVDGIWALVGDAGYLLLSGASVGALVRGSAPAVPRARTAARRTFERAPRVPEAAPPPPVPLRPRSVEPPVDGVSDFPDVVGQAEPPPLLAIHEDEPTEETEQQALFQPPNPSKADYVLPEASVLRRSPPQPASKSGATDQTAQALVRALADFGVEARVVGEITGPRVTRFELQLSPGTKMSKVAALKDDLSYALATTEIRILAPIPGKQAVGVEVPNLAPRIVTLGDVFDQLPSSASPLSVWLGKDISGNAVWTDLARMPHLLIAGTTGAGKSGCINTILSSILLRATPDDARLILIDPKRIELSLYETLPHLLVVIDELADLMMISPQQVEDAVIRLAQKSRAVGIHLVLATQRPSVDVITGM